MIKDKGIPNPSGSKPKSPGRLQLTMKNEKKKKK